MLCYYLLRLRIWWQPGELSANSRFDSLESTSGGGEEEMVDVGGGRARKEARADRQPDASRPNLITVPETDFTVKDTSPDLGKAVDYKQHFDLVEQMTYLFVRVVRARGLLGKDQNGYSDPVRTLLLKLILTCHELTFYVYKYF